MSIKPEELADAIAHIMDAYDAEVIAATKEAAKEVAKETNDVIKSHATFGGSGQYLRAFAVKKTDETTTGATYTWYVRAPYYRLTHLLEKGHAIKGGTGRSQTVGKSRIFEHIRYGEDYAQREYPKRIKEKLE